MSLGTILIIILIIALLGGFSGLGGGPFYGTGYYGGGGLGLDLHHRAGPGVSGPDLRAAPGAPEQERAPGALPPHVEEAVQSIALLHNAHHRDASPLEEAVDYATALVSRPACLVVIGVAVLLWVALNTSLPGKAFDPPPFALGDGILTLLALVVAVLIVTSQRRAGRLGERREQMTLELTLLTEQKTAKIIALIEELRRDSPELHDRIDREAHEMSARVDANAVLGAIEETASSIAANAPEPAEKDFCR